MKTNLFRRNYSSLKWGMRVLRLVLLLLPLLGRGLGGGCVLFAQNGVTVSGLAIDAGTVTFNVSWNKATMPVALWSDTVWVFVDYNKNGRMERLPVTGATVSAGTVEKIPDNDKGIWVMGNARDAGAFSATVQLLTEVKDVAGVCAYGSSYPPVGEYKNNATEISFTGTPMYEISLTKPDGGTATVKSDNPFLLPCDYTLTSFTDATGAPGRLSCISPATYTLSGSDICPGSDVALTLSGSENGWRYQLYKDNMPIGTEKEGTGSALIFSETFPAIGRFNYTVRTVDATGAQCEMRMSNVLAITVNPVPTIFRSGGNARQTANQNTAITAMTYTASNAATISMTGGSLPAGVSGTATGFSFTISGTPSATGTFSYSLTAAVGGCTSTAAVGTLTVYEPNTPHAASTQTWTYGTTTWSDVVMATPVECNLTDAFSTTDYMDAEYQEYYGHIYYKWSCAIAAQATLCPEPWRVPTYADLQYLRNNAGWDLIVANWGLGGVWSMAIYVPPGKSGRLLSIDTAGGWRNYYLRWELDQSLILASSNTPGAAEVRCVK
jgi:hypothetical protein